VLAIALPYFVPLFDRLLHDALQMTMQVLRLANPTAP
jgi:flagellar biosynthetic protein FliR